MIPWDCLWCSWGSGLKIGKKFEKPYRYINRGFSPGTGGWPHLATISVPNYRMTPADTSEPNDRGSGQHAQLWPFFRSADYSC